MASKRPAIEILSDDPEVMALQAMIKGARHITIKNLSPMHLVVLSSVEMFIKLGKQPPRIDQIAMMANFEISEFSVELDQLVSHGYIHENMPTYGDVIMTYSIGAKGGSALRHILDRKSTRARKPVKA